MDEKDGTSSTKEDKVSTLEIIEEEMEDGMEQEEEIVTPKP